MAYGRGWGLLLNNMCRYQKKITEKHENHENFSSNHFVIPGKKIQYLNDGFPLSSRPSNYSALEIWRVSNIIYSQERNMRIAGYRL